MQGLHIKWLAKTIVQLQTSSPLPFPAVLFLPLTRRSHKFRHSGRFTFQNYVDEMQLRSCGQVVCSPLALRTPFSRLGEWKSNLAGYGMTFVLQWNLFEGGSKSQCVEGKLSLPETGLPDLKSYFILDDFQIWQGQWSLGKSQG